MQRTSECAPARVRAAVDPWIEPARNDGAPSAVASRLQAWDKLHDRGWTLLDPTADGPAAARLEKELADCPPDDVRSLVVHSVVRSMMSGPGIPPDIREFVQREILDGAQFTLAFLSGDQFFAAIEDGCLCVPRVPLGLVADYVLLVAPWVWPAGELPGRPAFLIPLRHVDVHLTCDRSTADPWGATLWGVSIDVERILLGEGDLERARILAARLGDALVAGRLAAPLRAMIGDTG